MRIISRAAPVALLLLVTPSLADDGWRFPTDRITLDQWQTYRTETLAKPGATSKVAAGQLIITVPSEKAIYVFTQPEHPAHPAVIVRAVVEQGSGVFLSRKGHFGGSKDAFDAWWKEFDALDGAVRHSGEKLKH
jgi:hypothetical protein